MERQPFILKGRTTFKGFMRALPFIVGYLAILFIILFVIGPRVGGLLIFVLVIGSLLVVSGLYSSMTRNSRRLELLMSPCPKCGLTPMRFEPGSKGDYAFICDKCQIEWTLDVSANRHK